MDNESLAELEVTLGLRFRDPSLLHTALTHPSYRNEGHPDLEHNERLELLGDAVVNLVVAAALYQRLPRADEGQLTRARARAVSRESLAAVARRLELGTFLRLGKGARNRDLAAGHDRVLCAVFEAIVGAIFLDAGFDAASAFVLRHLEPLLSGPEGPSEEKDSKTSLQEVIQAMFQCPPRYRVVSRAGPAHAPEFEIELSLPDGRTWRGRGGSKREAERNAASLALRELQPREHG